LWAINIEAWALYLRLCSRAVSTLEIAGPMVLRETATWSTEAVWDVLARLTIILDVMQPQEKPR